MTSVTVTAVTSAVAVEVTEGAGADVVEITAPSTVGIDVIHPGPQGPSAAHERRHDWAAPYSYCGTAPDGTLDTAALWTVTRIEVASNGSVLTTTAATNVTWTGRAGHTYT